MQVYSISQVTDWLAEVVSEQPQLQDLWVEGEVAQVQVAASGHCYLTLKDDRTSVRCVIFRTNLLQVGFEISTGMTLLAHGRANIYTGRAAEVQLVFDQAQPSGIGALYLAFEQLRKRLEQEGLFDAALKRRAPFLPKRVAVVTSEGSAALRDVLKVLRRRAPIVSVLLVHTPVQGENAAFSIVRALRQAAARSAVDVILLVRGGGSIEDLVAFNDEGVARAIRQSQVPVIVGVGHETDSTIADFVADLCAATPSVAAEMAVPDVGELRRDVRALRQRLGAAIDRNVADKRERLEVARRRLEQQSPTRRLPLLQQQLDERVERLRVGLQRGLDRARRKLESDRAQLAALSPIAVLGRGYSLTRDEQGGLVTSVRQLAAGRHITTVFADGEAASEVQSVSAGGQDG